MQDAHQKSENRFTELHLSETLKLCCQSAICNLGGLRTVCNAFGGLRDPEETLLPATVPLYSYYAGVLSQYLVLLETPLRADVLGE